MKLTEQRCPACNGTLKIDEKNPHVAVCEYCKSRYILEWENGLTLIGNGNEQKAGPKGSGFPGKKRPEKDRKTGVSGLLRGCSGGIGCPSIPAAARFRRTDSPELCLRGGGGHGRNGDRRMSCRQGFWRISARRSLDSPLRQSLRTESGPFSGWK